MSVVLDPTAHTRTTTLDGSRDETLRHVCRVHQNWENRGSGDGCYANPDACVSACGVQRRPNFRDLPKPCGPQCVVCFDWWRGLGWQS